MVLPCIGSHAHTTDLPSRLTARSNGGSRSATLPAPKRQISVSRPGSFSGLRMSISRSRSSASSEGPHLSPIGFLMPRKNSTCAWSCWRGRGILARERLLEPKQERLMARVELGGLELGMALEIEPARLHEAERVGD